MNYCTIQYCNKSLICVFAVLQLVSKVLLYYFFTCVQWVS